jgi:hypothetical protein
MMTKKKVKVIISTGIVLSILIILLYVGPKYESHRFKNNFIDFDTTDIIGEIEYVSLASHSVVFRIKGNSKMFIFYPRTSELNKNRIFDHLVEKGDTIIKGKFSDTLRLIKNGDEYLYTFDQLK